MSQTPPKMILVNKPHPPATPTQNSGPVYPSLKDCQSPVEQILPALSPSSKFTHGLLQLVSAQNLTTVGSISSLSEHEVQTLPIKSPKVQTLRGALRSFEQQLQGSKRKSSVDSEAVLATPPPRKQARLDSDLSSASATTTTSKESSAVSSEASNSRTKEERIVKSQQGERRKREREGERERVEKGEEEMDSTSELAEIEYLDSEELSLASSHDINQPIITLCTPESQLTPPGDIASHDGDVDAGPLAEGEGMEKLESDSNIDDEKMEVEENEIPLVKTVLPESPPESPPTTPPNSSVSHDHTYCSPSFKNGNNSENKTTVEPLCKSEISDLVGESEKERDGAGGSTHSVLSVMVHDHTYCSQRSKEESVADNAHPSTNSGESKEIGKGEGERGGEVGNRSKLSLAVHDHTYCSNAWQQKSDPCLVEAAPQQHLQDGRDDRGTTIKKGERETTSERVMKEEDDTPLVTGEMEIAEVEETSQIELDTSMDSDVFTEEGGESSSSQSQELFSQQTSQVQDDGITDMSTSVPPNRDSLTSLVSHRGGAVGTVTVEREESVVVARGDGHSADSAKTVERHAEGAQDEEGDGESGQKTSETEEKVSSTKVKVQLQPHLISTGSNGSSDSSNPTNIAECSQRPPSLDSTPSSLLPLTGPSPSTSEQTCSKTSKYVDALSRLKDISEEVNEIMEQKSSMTREELSACQKTAGTVATSAQKLFQALMQHLT